MSTQVRAYAVKTAKGKLEPFSYDPPALQSHEVRVAPRFCGVCHSDIAMMDNDWGFTTYPLVPGHEVVGTVTEIGADVHGLKTGQVVGVGWQSGSCAECEWCRRGKEHLCAQESDTIVGRHGGYASGLVVDANFAVPMPAELDKPEAAPLLCAGNTVFGPILHHNVRSNMSVAVVGVGGLGHLAVQFLSKWGCDVTAISSTHSKDEEARGLGAKHFIATKGTDELKKASDRFDFILSTVSADIPWADYLAALRPEGTMVIVGIPEKDMPIPAMALIQREKTVTGGRASSPADIDMMLRFAARTGVEAMIEKFPLAEVNTAIDRARNGKVRYRAVLEI